MTNEAHISTYGGSLQVHRLTPGSVYIPAGCVTLCIPCHGPKPRRPMGQKFKDEPGTLHRVSLSHGWYAVLGRIAAIRGVTPLQALFSIAAADAKQLGITDLPATPWAEESDES